jgi:hypothetical protein
MRIDTLAASSGSSLVGYLPAGTGGVATTVQGKLRESVSVKDFGAVCDGSTNDWAAIQAAQEYLKANGGGTLYFPGFCYINAPFYYYGSVTGGTSAYPNPNQPVITWRSNGAGGIKSGITSGDVLRLSSSAGNLFYTVGFKDFVINCGINNVTALNGYDQGGITGANNYVDIDGLTIHGIQGANAIGIDFGTITDSAVRRLTVQGYGTGPWAGVRTQKADVQLIDSRMVYCKYGIVIGSGLAESSIVMFGGGIASSKTSAIYYESAVSQSYYSSSAFYGCFIGESALGSYILQAGTPSNIVSSSISFYNCVFDSYRASSNIITTTWVGNFTFIGCNYYAGAALANTVNFGSTANVTWLNNTGITIDSTSSAITSGTVNDFAVMKSIPFTPAFSSVGGIFNTTSSKGYWSKVGDLVTVNIRMNLGTTGNTFASSALSISGLPFAAANNTFENSFAVAGWNGLATAMVGIQGQIAANTTAMTLYKITTATAGSLTNPMLDSDLGNSSAIIELTATYFAAN